MYTCNLIKYTQHILHPTVLSLFVGPVRSLSTCMMYDGANCTLQTDRLLVHNQVNLDIFMDKNMIIQSYVDDVIHFCHR